MYKFLNIVAIVIGVALAVATAYVLISAVIGNSMLIGSTYQ